MEKLFYTELFSYNFCDDKYPFLKLIGICVFLVFIKFFRLFSWLCLLHSIRELWSVDSERFFELLGCDIPYCYELSSYFQARKRPTIHTRHSECKSEKVIYECYRDSKLIKWCFFYFSESCAW